MATTPILRDNSYGSLDHTIVTKLEQAPPSVVYLKTVVTDMVVGLVLPAISSVSKHYLPWNIYFKKHTL